MTTHPDDLYIGLTDGAFYGGDPFPAFAWMRDNAVERTVGQPDVQVVRVSGHGLRSLQLQS